MPKLTFEAEITAHFTYHREVTTPEHYRVDREYIEVGKVELPSDEDLEEWIWELKDKWKED